MSALAIPRPAIRAAVPVAAPGSRRGHLQLVGPGYVPAPQRADVTASTPRVSAAPAPRQAHITLSARGRMVRSLLAVVLGMAIAIGAGSWLGTLAGGQEYAGAVEQVSVAAGDTLWTIAAATAGSGQDVRDLVDDIVQLNGLGSADLAAGQQLLVPAG